MTRAELTRQKVIRPDWAAIAKIVAHRPWPMPDSPWMMTMSWQNLLFAHWPISPAVLRPHIPACFDVDTFDGEGWISVVPFIMSDVGPRGLSRLPWVSKFAELNVRTYVRHKDKAGVYFFSLDAANPVAVRVARMGFHLPYHDARFELSRFGARQSYQCKRSDGTASFVGEYEPLDGELLALERDSLERWLFERYCFFTVDRAQRPYVGEVQHAPWSVRGAASSIRINTMTAPQGLALPDVEPLCHHAERLDVLGWPVRPVV
ncbi:MAG: DUF2071 domain-containing protein [Deltaproteobacteria bacterium]|nr:DUF2071 domain-containing protein [Deltaproteobacteria bacterium]